MQVGSKLCKCVGLCMVACVLASICVWMNAHKLP
jgi:hypothetical protein